MLTGKCQVRASESESLARALDSESDSGPSYRDS